MSLLSTTNLATTTLMSGQIEIVPFEQNHQQAVEDLVLPIQQGEFGVKITREEQPDLMNIKEVFQHGNGNFWVALCGDAVVGTIGVIDIGDRQTVLKKMFVARQWRGKQHGIGARLMERAKQWCKASGVRSIFLGTTPQMVAAHRFYEKSGFREVSENALPAKYPMVHVDKKFYQCDL